MLNREPTQRGKQNGDVPKKPFDQYTLPKIKPNQHAGKLENIKKNYLLSLPIMDDKIPNLKMAYMLTKDKLTTDEIAGKHRRKLLMKQIPQMDAKWKMLERREEAFKNTVVRFNEFVKRNLIKRERVAETIKTNKAQIAKYLVMIEAMQMELSVLEESKRVMAEEIRKHSIYTDCLEKVVSKSNEFKSVSSFVESLSLLWLTLEDSAEKFEDNKVCLEKLIHEWKTKMMERVFLTDYLSNRLSALYHSYTEATNKCFETERIVRDVRNECSQIMLQLEIVIGTIDQLYQYICKRDQKIRILEKGECTKQLMIIHHVLGMFEKIKKRKRFHP